MKVFHPDAAVRHAHEYGPLDFVKRYFDEYRGLHETSGHVEPLRPSAALRGVARRRALDARPGRARARAGALARALGRAPQRPPGGLARWARARIACRSRAQRALSLERRGAASRRPPAGRGRAARSDGRRAGANPYEALCATGPGRRGAAGRAGARDGRAALFTWPP